MFSFTPAIFLFFQKPICTMQNKNALNLHNYDPRFAKTKLFDINDVNKGSN